MEYVVFIIWNSILDEMHWQIQGQRVDLWASALNQNMGGRGGVVGTRFPWFLPVDPPMKRDSDFVRIMYVHECESRLGHIKILL